MAKENLESGQILNPLQILTSNDLRSGGSMYE